MDGAGWHVAKDLSLPDNITLLKLPPCATDLNSMEAVWEHIRAKGSPSPYSTVMTRSSTNAATRGTSLPITLST
ncbi:hypothetical protein [Hoeflea sp.]|uniref:hypothetical protein n=1 Tax=Hoeflea sp. TaxID=1940281 RepID=UPI003B017EFF